MINLRQIHILPIAPLPRHIILDIRGGIEEALRAAGNTDIIVRHIYGDTPQNTGPPTIYTAQIAKCMADMRLASGHLPAKELLEAIVPMRRDPSHAMFLVVKDQLHYEGKRGPYDIVGYADHEYGVGAILTLAPSPMDAVAASAYAWVNAMHETAHLLGLKRHCRTNPCVMRERHTDDEYLNQTLSVAPFCAKCLFALQREERKRNKRKTQHA